MAKKIKFPLILKDQNQARTIEEVKDFFDLERIYEYYLNGKLLIWLQDRYYEEEVQKLQGLDPSSQNIHQKLCEIFSVNYQEQATFNQDISKRRQEKLKLLKQLTDDDEILTNVDNTALNQEELSDLLDEGIQTIYLCDNTFSIPLTKSNMEYIGLGASTVNIKSNKDVSLDQYDIVLKNLTLSCATPIKVTCSKSCDLKIVGGTAGPDDNYEVYAKMVTGYHILDKPLDSEYRHLYAWSPEPYPNSVKEDSRLVLYSKNTADNKEYYIGLLSSQLWAHPQDMEKNSAAYFSCKDDYIYFIEESNISEVYDPVLKLFKKPNTPVSICRSTLDGKNKTVLISAEDVADYTKIKYPFNFLSIYLTDNYLIFQAGYRSDYSIPKLFLIYADYNGKIINSIDTISFYRMGGSFDVDYLKEMDGSYEMFTILYHNSEKIIYLKRNSEPSPSIICYDLKHCIKEVIAGDINNAFFHKNRAKAAVMLVGDYIYYIYTEHEGIGLDTYTAKYDIKSETTKKLKKIPARYDGGYGNAVFKKEQEKIYIIGEAYGDKYKIQVE